MKSKKTEYFFYYNVEGKSFEQCFESILKTISNIEEGIHEKSGNLCPIVSRR